MFGGLGIVLALLGLWIALKQLTAIKTESEAATAAINNVQLKIAAFDTAQECRTAKSLIGSLREGLISEDWDTVIKLYEALIQSFLNLSHSNSTIENDDRDLLIKMTHDMAKICDGIRKRKRTGSVVAVQGQDQAIRDFSDIMTKISFLVAKDMQK